MNFDRSLSLSHGSAIRADLQTRADMLGAAVREFERNRRCMVALESVLVRWLIEHRETFGDRFCTFSLLARLPLPEAASTEKAEGRLRERLAYAQALRPACFHAVSLRRDDLGGLSVAEAQIALRLHTRAYARASEAGWEIAPLEAACTTLDDILTAEAAREIDAGAVPLCGLNVAVSAA